MNEADTCREYVIPRLQSAGWQSDPHAYIAQKTFTDGRIVATGGSARRKDGKRADYLLYYTRDFPIAVVEAKRLYKLPGDGMQQAKDYAEVLDLKFAFSTNGSGIVEFDYTTGIEQEIGGFPGPDELWDRLAGHAGIKEEIKDRLLSPAYRLSGPPLRYYQEIAVNRTLLAVLEGRRRMLLTMATGTGKTKVAFQICWRLWNSRWNRTGEYRRPRVLYLADRNILVDDPKDKDFAPFGAARARIDGSAVKSRELYFSTYQALAEDERRPGLYRRYKPDFFDLIVVDECHRGSARDDSNWREVLEYFEPAYQLGMTATPLNEETRNTYQYFGLPLYTYSLRQGIEDGFLAPYRVHRIVTDWDATGWRPSQGDLDRYGRAIPDREYTTEQFHKAVALKAHTEAVARNITDFLKNTDRFAKTIVFCVDQEHADEMRRALNNLNADLVRQYPDYVCRVTADEAKIGAGHLSRFQDVDRTTPVVLTTSQLLTTGVDAPTCRNIVLARVVGTMVEFKQIIGRGTRVRDDYGKLYFNILDYTGSATHLFADPAFDGDPVIVLQARMGDDGETVAGSSEVIRAEGDGEDEVGGPQQRSAEVAEPDPRYRHRYYFDGGQVQIVAHLVYELDPDGKQLRVVKLTDYAADKVRTLYPSPSLLRALWADPEERPGVIGLLVARGIHFSDLAEAAGQPDADPLDLLCHLAYHAPLRTRRERVERLRLDKQDFFARFGPEARAILEALLEKYAEYGEAQFRLPQILEVPPISDHGTVSEIIEHFGEARDLRQAVIELQRLLYAA